MDNTMIFFVYLSTVAFLLSPTTSSLEITSTAENRASKQFVFFWPTKSNIQRTSSFSEETMNLLPSTGFTDSMTNVFFERQEIESETKKQELRNTNTQPKKKKCHPKRQKKIQHQTMEGFHRLLQLHACRSSH